MKPSQEYKEKNVTIPSLLCHVKPLRSTLEAIQKLKPPVRKVVKALQGWSTLYVLSRITKVAKTHICQKG